MFQNLRVGTPLYVLHKSEPHVEVGEVVSVSQPTPKFSTAYQAGMAYNQQNNVVDVKIKVGDDTIDLQQLPAEQMIADFGTNGMVISESKDAILNEVELLRKKSSDVIDSIDHHKSILEKCESIISELNPSVKQEAERQKEMEHMKDELADIKGMLAKILGKKSKED